MMKGEADALRHELNEWRARAGVPFAEEPMRSDAFGIVVRGELEFEAGDLVDGEEGEDDEDGGNPGVYGGRQYATEPVSYAEEVAEDYAMMQRQQQEHAEMIAAQMQAPFAHAHTVLHPSAPHPSQGYPVNPGHRQPAVPSTHYYAAPPTIVNPALAPFENPAMGYEQHPAAAMHAEWAFEKQQQMLHAQQQRQGTW